MFDCGKVRLSLAVESLCLGFLKQSSISMITAIFVRVDDLAHQAKEKGR